MTRDSQQWADVMERVRRGTTTAEDARYLEAMRRGLAATVKKTRECAKWAAVGGG